MQIEKLASVVYWSDAEGRSAVIAWRASGLTKKAFARRHGIAAQRITYWERRLPSSSTMRADITLAPVTVLATPPRESDIAIELRSGHVVRVRGDVEEVQLVRVIRAAERAGC